MGFFSKRSIPPMFKKNYKKYKNYLPRHQIKTRPNHQTDGETHYLRALAAILEVGLSSHCLVGAVPNPLPCVRRGLSEHTLPYPGLLLPRLHQTPWHGTQASCQCLILINIPSVLTGNGQTTSKRERQRKTAHKGRKTIIKQNILWGKCPYHAKNVD